MAAMYSEWIGWRVLLSMALIPGASGATVPALGGRLNPAQARAALGAAPELDDALARGRVVVWQSAGARSLPGAVGAGWRSEEAGAHRDPGTIVLVGTSHIIGVAQSAQLVRAVVQAARPDAVVVELCRSRRGLLYAPPPPPSPPGPDGRGEGGDSGGHGAARGPNPFGVSGSSGEGRLAAVGRSLQLGGSTSLALRLLLARAAATAVRAEEAGAAGDARAGGAAAYSDFVAAREAAEGCNASLVLGDRPLEITLERAWNAMGAGEKGALLAAGLRLALSWPGRSAAPPADPAAEGGADGPEAAVARAGGVDVEAMAELLAQASPALHACLVQERDIYLSLTAKSSRAVSGCRCVVAVVGAGHVEGVARALDERHDGAFKALTWTPRRARAKVRVLGVLPAPLVDRLARDAVLGLALYAALQLCQS